MLKVGFYIKLIEYNYLFEDITVMSKNNYKKSRLKAVFLAFTCAAVFTFSGIASACGDDTEKEKDKTNTKEDTQLLKNGNFEFFTIPEKKEDGNEPEYLIKTPESWTHGGTNSYTMSGIISTSKASWDKLSADSLADDLDYNNNLDSSASNYLSEYVDYNGMKSSDIFYKNQYEALRDEDDYEEGEEPDPNRKDRIENPGTHYNVTEKDGEFFYKDKDGSEKKVFVDNKGEYFLEYDETKDKYSQPISNVLMLHNYATAHNGIAQYYSSVEVELPANTAAEISVWVKTSYLKFSQGKEVKQDRGANISVTQTVGSATIDKFTISSINTEKLIREKAVEDNYNGWVEYTVYVNACDFASSKIKLELGLGETGYNTEGYAFFDDVSVTKFASLDEKDGSSFKANEYKLKDTTVNLSTDASEKVFKADSYVRNDASIINKRFSENFHYYIDLASEYLDYGDSENTYTPISFKGVKNLRASYTVDDDNYVSSKLPITRVNKVGFTDLNLTAVNDKWHLPFKSSLETQNDLLAYVTTKDKPFTSSQTDYADKLNAELAGAADLPKNVGSLDNMLVMLSAYGAAYTTSFDLNIPAEGYQIVSFWVKTSDMDGSTASTVSITQNGNDENTANFNLDTTGKVTNVGDKENEKDIFDGWVQCFFFVKNELKEPADYTVKFSFGNTTIKGTDVHSYKKGWAALANMQTLNVNEKIFSYTGSGTTTASLTIVEEAEKKTQVFDEAYANQSHEIKDNVVLPASYKGVNGGSSAITNNGHVSIPFDEFNNNVDGSKDNPNNYFTGLINKEHFIASDSAYRNLSWYQTLLNNFSVNASTISALDAWNEVFGKSVQPLIISNRKRKSYVEERGATEDTFRNFFVKDDYGNFVHVAEDAKFDEKETYYSQKDVINYGYISEDKQVAADSYATVSVRVKVSKNAVAYVYLVDTSSDKNVLAFSAPSYSFYYDTDGNVLKAEPKSNATVSEQRENVLYHLRDDGLYEDNDGKLFANTLNYKKLYYIEDMTYYDETGKAYAIEDLVDGVTYYDSDKENKKEANHYLVTTDGAKLYEFKDGNYYYIVEGKTQSDVINTFDTQYARYNFNSLAEDYAVEINGKDHAGEWITVTFVLHAGSEIKNYRLELWSGKREQTETEGNKEGETVIFDYSYATVSDDSMKDYYEQEIIKSYQNALVGKDGALEGIDTAGKNIAFYEKLAKENSVEIDTDYKAHYYTFSLYDSPNFVPFNKEVADEDATGYDYNVADQTEKLAYLKIKEGNEYTVFADYSTVDKSITLNDASGDTEDDTEQDEEKETDGSVWLLISSIVLVVALVFAMIAIFVKDALKKSRKNKVTSQNNYDQRKVNRYKRKLGLQQEEVVEVEHETNSEPESEEETSDQPEQVEEPTPTEDAEDNADAEQTEESETPDENKSEE